MASSPDWTFFSNYAHVLLCIAETPGIRLRDVAERVGITERAVQRIVADLEELDIYRGPARAGATTTRCMRIAHSATRSRRIATWDYSSSSSLDRAYRGNPRRRDEALLSWQTLQTQSPAPPCSPPR